jgi:hypothetical protein
MLSTSSFLKYGGPWFEVSSNLSSMERGQYLIHPNNGKGKLFDSLLEGLGVDNFQSLRSSSFGRKSNLKLAQEK